MTVHSGTRGDDIREMPMTELAPTGASGRVKQYPGVSGSALVRIILRAEIGLPFRVTRLTPPVATDPYLSILTVRFHVVTSGLGLAA
jgi:hypothetical protein